MKNIQIFFLPFAFILSVIFLTGCPAADNTPASPAPNSNTPTVTSTPSNTPTNTPTPTVSDTPTITPTVTSTATYLCTPSHYGNDTEGGGIGGLNNGTIMAKPITLAAPVTAIDIQVYVGLLSGTTQMRAAIYNQVSTSPGSVLVEASPVVASSNTWNSMNVSYNLAAGYYWLAIEADSTGSNTPIQFLGGPAPIAFLSSVTWGPFPTWSGGSFLNTNEYSIYLRTCP